MVRTRFALILYFRMVAHKAACHTLSKAFLKSMKTWYRFCWCWRKDSRLIMLYKGLKGAASIPTNDLVPPIRRTRNHHSLAFQIPMAWTDIYKSRKENPQKLTQLSSRSHPRHLVGKRTAQKDTIIDITSDSQVNSNFPYRWSPASLTFNNYFYLFLYLYIT